jgi:hypothetical protein
MNNKTGGPAFPTPAHNLQNDGMTLRDYFAGLAMQSLILGLTGHDNEIPDTAEDAYRFADAMLKARQA